MNEIEKINRSINLNYTKLGIIDNITESNFEKLNELLFIL